MRYIFGLIGSYGLWVGFQGVHNWVHVQAELWKPWPVADGIDKAAAGVTFYLLAAMWLKIVPEHTPIPSLPQRIARRFRRVQTPVQP